MLREPAAQSAEITGRKCIVERTEVAFRRIVNLRSINIS
jgi:hypothetical protein